MTLLRPHRLPASRKPLCVRFLLVMGTHQRSTSSSTAGQISRYPFFTCTAQQEKRLLWNRETWMLLLHVQSGISCHSITIRYHLVGCSLLVTDKLSGYPLRAESPGYCWIPLQYIVREQNNRLGVEPSKTCTLLLLLFTSLSLAYRREAKSENRTLGVGQPRKSNRFGNHASRRP